MARSCFVFGSNLAGRHGAGAALVARKDHGAVLGKGIGFSGSMFGASSYAIPTKSFDVKRTLPLPVIMHHVLNFIRFAKANSMLEFQVTRIGCGLAGLNDEDVAPMFFQAPPNCSFDEVWEKDLGPNHKYWGTY